MVVDNKLPVQNEQTNAILVEKKNDESPNVLYDASCDRMKKGLDFTNVNYKSLSFIFL